MLQNKYYNKYLKYKNKYLKLQSQNGGNLQEWWNYVIDESKIVLNEAQIKEDVSNYRFFINGSMAIIFYLNKLLTEDISILNDEKKIELNRICETIRKPNDIDIFSHKRTPSQPTDIFEIYHYNLLQSDPDHRDKIPSQMYIDIGSYYSNLPFLESSDYKFKKREEKVSNFNGLDFGFIEGDYYLNNINGTFIIGLLSLYDSYRYNIRNKEDTIKIHIIKFILDCLDTDELKYKYNGTFISEY
jgi:hypothetical protein